MKKNLTVFLFLFFASYFVYAQQKATIVSDDVDVYAEQDFDSEILETVHKNETYWISNKTFGPFYRIKLKSGKIGYIPDHELNILEKDLLGQRPLVKIQIRTLRRILKPMPNQHRNLQRKNPNSIKRWTKMIRLKTMQKMEASFIFMPYHFI